VGSLTNASTETLAECIGDGLGRLASRAGVERGSFARVSEEADALTMMYTSGAPAMPTPFRADLHWYLEKLRHGRCLTMNRLPGDLPAEAAAERESFRAMGIRSHVAVPLFTAGRLSGVIALATSLQARLWMPEDIQRLRVAGEIMISSIQRHEAEATTRRLRDELTHVARVASLGDLTVALTHELNQPLAAIRANAQATQRLLARGVPPVELDDVLGDIVGDAGRAADLILRLATLFRRGELERIPVDVNQVVRDLHVIARTEARRHGARLVLRLAPDLREVAGDPVQLQQVLLNLIRNAAEAMANLEAGAREVKVSTSATASGQIAVSVEDSGPAIDDAVFDGLFRQFYTTKPDGLGMGLAISRSIVEAHGGRLWAERRAAGGLMMRFTLPVTVTRTTADHPLQPSAPANVAPGLDKSAITD
jgi:signal transduction histidine kinase